MTPDELIKAYVDDVAPRLPRGQRQDVALELHALLRDELAAKAQAAGAPPDAAMALSLLQAFGRPEDVADRYRIPGITLIDPLDSKSFLIASAAGVAVLWTLAAIDVVTHAHKGTEAIYLIRDWWTGSALVSLFWWPGFLTLCYALKSQTRRRRSKMTVWQPQALDRDRAKRIGPLIAIPLALAGTVCLAAPAWTFHQLLPRGIDTNWILYTDAFRSERLPWLIAFLLAHLALYAAIAIQGRWSPLTRRIDIGANLFGAGLFLWCILGGAMYQEPPVDQFAKSIIAVIAGIVLVRAGVQINRELSRTRAL